MEFSRPKIIKVFLAFQEGTLKSQAKKISYSLSLSKNKFIHI